MTPFAHAFLVFTLRMSAARAEDTPAPESAPALVPAAEPAAAPAPTAASPNFGPPPPLVPAAKFPGTETWPDFIPLEATEGRDLSPYGYRPAHRVKQKLTAVGGGVFAGAYIGAVAVGFATWEDGLSQKPGYLLVPVLGPTAWGSSNGFVSGVTELVILDTAAQATGAVLLTIGLLGRDGWERKPGFLLVPLATSGGAGLAVMGAL